LKIIEENFNEILNYPLIWNKKGFWGFGEQDVTERKAD
jgi:hypothetical protein